MKNKPQIAVLGGDMRQYAVAKELSKKNVSVYVSGLCMECIDGRAIKLCEEYSSAVSAADAVVLPLPAATDGVWLNCLGCKKEDRISLENIISAMSEKAVLLGGSIPRSIAVKAQARGIKVYDYFLSEKLQIKNAYITAEAALSVAMNSLDRCIRGSRVAVTGTGRISRLLSELLVSVGADVCTVGRSNDKLVYFELSGCETLIMNENWQDELLEGYDVIFNTVPSWLFDRNFLENVDKDTLIIELASAPGGVDICAARELMSNVRWAPSLPGKYAPYSAGKLIAECIVEIMSSEEVGLL